jgi:hypothetical protein
MPRRTSDADRARGERIAEIRAQIPDRSQETFADAMTKAANAMGLTVKYRYYTISRMEGGSISFEDAAVALSLDKERRGWDWFVFGTDVRTARQPLPRKTTNRGGASGAGGR